MFTQVCFSRGSDLQKTVTRFEEWRRYSEFYDLDVALREEFGYHMERIKFPPKRTFGNLLTKAPMEAQRCNQSSVVANADPAVMPQVAHTRQA